jgi:hypothetical protein
MSKRFSDNFGDLPDTPRTPPTKIPPLIQEIDNPDKTKGGEKEKEKWPQQESETGQQFNSI